MGAEPHFLEPRFLVPVGIPTVACPGPALTQNWYIVSACEETAH